MPRKEENIYERKDGRFEARYLTGRDENSRAKYSSVYGKSRAEVREKLAEVKRELYGNPSPHEGRTFREVAEEWLKKNRDNIANTTHDRYKDALERDIYPEYGDTIIFDVTYRELNRFLLVVADKAEKKGRTLNKSGIMIIKTVMSNVLQYASVEEPMEKADLGRESVSYEELSSAEL